MKKSDIAMIILIAGVSALTSYLILNSILGDPGEKTETVMTMEVINSDHQEPQKDIFFDGAINPTNKIIIGSDEENIISGK